MIDFNAKLTAVVGFVLALAESADTKEGTDVVTRARNAGTVIAVVVIGIVALVGIMIFGQIDQAMPATNTSLDTVMDDIVGGFGDAMGLVPIILLVLLASVVIGVVQRMRR